MDTKSRSNKFWFVGSLLSPYIVVFAASFIMSLIWNSARDIPVFAGIVSLDLIPFWLAIGALLYCFSEIKFSSWWTKVLTISMIFVYAIFTAPIAAIFVSCIIWNDCP